MSDFEQNWPMDWFSLKVAMSVILPFWEFLKVFLLLITKDLCQNFQSQKDSLETSYERTVVSEVSILAGKWFKTAARKKLICGFVNHPAVYSGGVSSGRVHGCSCWRLWHVTCDMWHSATVHTYQEIWCLLSTVFYWIF